MITDRMCIVRVVEEDNVSYVGPFECYEDAQDYRDTVGLDPELSEIIPLEGP